jgi:hypothetical protein
VKISPRKTNLSGRKTAFSPQNVGIFPKEQPLLSWNYGNQNRPPRTPYLRRDSRASEGRDSHKQTKRGTRSQEGKWQEDTSALWNL